MRGRKAKPTSVQNAEGDPRKVGRHKLEERLHAEPQATRGLPGCPQHLKGLARRAWEFWKAELEDMGLDNRPDAMMLEGACVHYARAVYADALVLKEGPVVDEVVMYEGKAVEGVTRRKKNPAVTVSNESWEKVRAFCSEFGLSPVSRTRLTVDSKPKQARQNIANLLSQPYMPSSPNIQ